MQALEPWFDSNEKETFCFPTLLGPHHGCLSSGRFSVLRMVPMGIFDPVFALVNCRKWRPMIGNAECKA